MVFNHILHIQFDQNQIGPRKVLSRSDDTKSVSVSNPPRRHEYTST